MERLGNRQATTPEFPLKREWPIVRETQEVVPDPFIEAYLSTSVSVRSLIG